MENRFSIQLSGAVYLPIKEVCSRYSLSKSSVYSMLKEMEESQRYRKHWVTLNDGGDRLINCLVFEDYLRYRTELKHPNVAKMLPPYDPKMVRKERGDLEVITNVIDESTVKTYVIEAVNSWLVNKLSS